MDEICITILYITIDILACNVSNAFWLLSTAKVVNEEFSTDMIRL